MEEMGMVNGEEGLMVWIGNWEIGGCGLRMERKGGGEIEGGRGGLLEEDLGIKVMGNE